MLNFLLIRFNAIPQVDCNSRKRMYEIKNERNDGK